MTNKYAGTCYKCGHICGPGAGVFERVSQMSRRKWPNLPYNIKWQLQHHECVRDYAKAAHHIENPMPPINADAKYQKR